MGTQLRVSLALFLGCYFVVSFAQTCPDLCICNRVSSRDYSVTCRGTALTSLPAGIPTDATSLVLRNTGIQILQANSLLSLNRLKVLHFLNNDRLSDIETNAFQGLSSLEELKINGHPSLAVVRVGLFLGLNYLQHLDLSENGWTEVTATMFLGLDRLQVLDLSHNKIKSLNTAQFSASLHQLADLDLSYNQLSTLDAQVFSNWDTLTSINLAANLFNLPPSTQLQNLPSLKNLDLSANPIPHLPPFSFRALINLESLKFSSQASLTTISANAFGEMHNLKHFEFTNNFPLPAFTVDQFPAHNMALEFINLSNNSFTNLQGEIFMERPNLTQVILENVPFHCDCKMSWMGEVIANTTRWPWAAQWNRNNNHTNGNQTKYPPKCATPKNLAIMDVGDLKEEDYTCMKAEFHNISHENEIYVNPNDSLHIQVSLYPGLPSTTWFHPRGWFVKSLRLDLQSEEKNSSHIAVEYIDRDRHIVSSLHLDALMEQDIGNYTLLASNAAGNSSYQFQILKDINGTWTVTPAPVVNSAKCLAPLFTFITIVYLSLVLMILQWEVLCE